MRADLFRNAGTSFSGHEMCNTLLLLSFEKLVRALHNHSNGMQMQNCWSAGLKIAHSNALGGSVPVVRLSGQDGTAGKLTSFAAFNSLIGTSI